MPKTAHKVVVIGHRNPDTDSKMCIRDRSGALPLLQWGPVRLMGRILYKCLSAVISNLRDVYKRQPVCAEEGLMPQAAPAFSAKTKRS